jgi:uncharacterized protein DUF1877
MDIAASVLSLKEQAAGGVLMPGRGVYYALSEGEDCIFRELRTPDSRLAFVGIVCERIRKPWREDVDKVWDPIHRCLTDGGLHYGRSPLYRCVLGTRNYLGEDNWHFINYVKAEDVPPVSQALAEVDEAFLRRNYEKIPQEGYTWQKGDEDFGFVWDFFKRVRRFYRRAAGDQRAVLFSCDL